MKNENHPDTEPRLRADVDELQGRMLRLDSETRRTMGTCANRIAELGELVRGLDRRTEAMSLLVARIELKLDEVTERESTAVRERAQLLERVRGYQAGIQRAERARVFWGRWWAKMLLLVAGAGGSELSRLLVAKLLH